MLSMTFDHGFRRHVICFCACGSRIITTDGELIKELSLDTENNYQKQ